MASQAGDLRARVYVSGRVQGVWFRGSTRQRARELGVSGWVRNLPDGRVEGLFEGEESAVRALVDWVQRGPPHARVDRVDVTWEAPGPAGASGGFRVR